MIRWTIGIILLSVLLGAPDRVHLKSGGVVEGEIISEDESGIVLKIGSIRSHFKRETILRIERGVVKEEPEKTPEEEKKEEEETPGPKGSIPWAAAKPVKLEHYEVTCNCAPDVAEEYRAYLERVYDALEGYFKVIGKPRGGRTRVYITRSFDEFFLLTGDEGVGGFYMPPPGEPPSLPGDTIVAYHGVFGEAGNTRTVLCHEVTHQFQRKILKGDHAPKWMIEGLAVFFEDSLEVGRKIVFQKKKKDPLGIIPRERLYQLKRSLESDEFYTPRDLIEMPAPRFGAVHYAPSWALVYYLMNAGGGKHREVLEGMWKAAVKRRLTPKEITEGLEKSLGMKIDEFGKTRWKRYFENMRIPPPGEVRAGKYRSQRRSFTFRPPGSWELLFDEYGDRDFRFDRECRLVNARLDGAGIEVIARPVHKVPEEKWSLEKAIEPVLARIEKDYHTKKPDRKAIEVDGQAGVRFAFIDRGEHGEAFTTGKGNEPRGTAHFMVCVPMADRYYEFHATCAARDRERVGKDFDRVVGSVRIDD